MRTVNWRHVLHDGWSNWLAPVLLAAWTLTSLFLVLRRYDTFQTATFDQAYYTQFIWNTAHGRWFINSLKLPVVYLADHFSPVLALLAPFFWIFPDGRVLLMAKVLALGSSIVPAYLLVRGRYPLVAPGLVLSFVANPTLYKLVLDTADFQGLVLGVPTLALAFYALQRERRLLLWEALALTLLVREDMGLYVLPFGLFLLLFRPRWRRTGVGIMLLAIAWTALVLKVLVPAAGFGAYVYLPRFVSANPVLASLAAGKLPALSDLMGLLCTPEKIGVAWSLLAPMALLPLLSQTGAQLLWLPGLLFLLAVPPFPAAQLRGHYYISPLVPLWWGVTAMTLAAASPRLAKAGVALLVGAAFIGAAAGGAMELMDPSVRARYVLTEHDRLGPVFLADIPPDAAVVAQSGLGPHLAARAQLKMFPWFDRSHRPQLIVLDAQAKDIYPFEPDDFRQTILNLQLDPTIRLAKEQDGYMVFALDVDPQIPHQGSWQWPPYLELEGYALVQTDAARAFQPAPFTPLGGRTLRVELYWTALAAMTADYKVSVVVMAPDSFILAQNDARPAQERLNTADWAPGRSIRDTHYVELPAYDLPSPLTLAVVVYDGASNQRLAREKGIVLTSDIGSVQTK